MQVLGVFYAPSKSTFPSLGPFTPLSIPSINFQIQLHAITNTIVFQRQLVLEWPFALPFEHDLVRFSANAGCDLGFEEFCESGAGC